MKITTVHYERLFKTEKYENERIGLTAEVQDEETESEVLETLKTRVWALRSGDSEHMAQAKRIIKNKKHHSFSDVAWANAYVGRKTTKTLDDWREAENEDPDDNDDYEGLCWKEL